MRDIDCVSCYFNEILVQLAKKQDIGEWQMIIMKCFERKDAKLYYEMPDFLRKRRIDYGSLGIRNQFFMVERVVKIVKAKSSLLKKIERESKFEENDLFLPDVLVEEILQYLPPKDLFCSIGMVSKKLYCMCRSERMIDHLNQCYGFKRGKSMMFTTSTSSGRESSVKNFLIRKQMTSLKEREICLYKVVKKKKMYIYFSMGSKRIFDETCFEHDLKEVSLAQWIINAGVRRHHQWKSEVIVKHVKFE